jgi:nucleoside-diphosphate-sugar epimerase
MISKMLGASPNPIYKDDLPGEAQVTLADITLAKSLGWEPKTPLHVGLQRSIDYIRKEMAVGRIP